MSWETHPVTPERFEDFADVINPNRRETHCWCVSHRLRAKDIEELGGGSREQAMRSLCEEKYPPGVVTYLDDVPVGWCNIGPRADIPRLAGSKLIRPVDDVPVWSIVCIVVRGGHRKKGVSSQLIEGLCSTRRPVARRRWRPTRSTRRGGWTPPWRSSALGRCSRRSASG